jgi:hypothetical protein
VPPTTIMGEWDPGLAWAVAAILAAACVRPANTRTTAGPGPLPGDVPVLTEPPGPGPARAGRRPGFFAPPLTGPPDPARGVPWSLAS